MQEAQTPARNKYGMSNLSYVERRLVLPLLRRHAKSVFNTRLHLARNYLADVIYFLHTQE